jgi:hypothetical protein
VRNPFRIDRGGADDTSRPSRDRPEIELLLLAMQPAPDPHSIARARALSSRALDWNLLVELATHHGVCVGVYAYLQSHGLISPEHTTELTLRARTSARRSLYLMGQLLRLLPIFEDAGIPVIPIKGPVLAVTAYGDLSRREFSDIDLLIREADTGAARALLARHGFRCLHHPDWIAAFTAFGHELDFVAQDGGVILDVQWRFAKRWLRMPLAPDALWQDTQTVTLAGCAVRQPSLEHNLLLLCGHGYRHCWSRLKWIADVAAFLQRFGSRIDATRTLEIARSNHSLRLLTLGAWLARELTATQLPPALAAAIEDDPATARLGRMVVRRLFRNTAEAPRGSWSALEAFVFHLHARESLAGKLPRLRPLATHGIYLLRRQLRHHLRRVAQRVLPMRRRQSAMPNGCAPDIERTPEKLA